MSEITMKDLLEAGVHFGHQTRRWNPKMRRFIFLERNGIHIMDLQKTVRCLETARKAIEDTVRQGGKILFVGTKKQAKDTIAEEAARCGHFWVTERWLGGTLTNFRTIRSNIQRLKEIEQMGKDGTLEKLNKKEASVMEKERLRLEKCFSGIKELGGLPQMLFIVDTKKEKIAVAEANRLRIPIVGVVDTNCDPDPINYPIPGNDDAIRAIKLFSRMVSDAVLEARQVAAEGKDVQAEAVYHAGPDEEGSFASVS